MILFFFFIEPDIACEKLQKYTKALNEVAFSQRGWALVSIRHLGKGQI